MPPEAPTSARSESPNQLRARVIVVGAAEGASQLTYAVPDNLSEAIQPGHRVLVPIRSRRVTAIVSAVARDLDSGGFEPKPIIELLEVRPLFDSAHLKLIEFMATYYMATLGEAFRSVIPATARVESRRLYHLVRPPDSLAAAALNSLERAILESVQRRPRALRQLSKLGDPPLVGTALRHLIAQGVLETREAVQGRHRETEPTIVKLGPKMDVDKVRGPKQRAILDRIIASGGDQAPLDDLEETISGARAAIHLMAKRGIVELIKAVASPSVAPRSADSLTLTDEQSAGLAQITPALRERRFETFLLWGITGSGKTEIYARLAAEALAAGRQALILVPEIALAGQVVEIFRERFGPAAAIVHSAQNISERWSGWMAALSGATRIMIGPRSAIFAPIHDLGLIVVDEEHDAAYKQEEGIRYNARDLAVALGQFSGCPVVLGSATPSAESYANARRGRYRLLRLTERIGGRTLASVEVVDLRQRPATGSTAPPKTESGETAPVPLSPVLIEALGENLAAAGQSMIFLNRRGYHNFLQCHLCGNVIACPNCSVSMTFHLRDRSLRCHYCGNRAGAPEKCAECGGYGLEGQGFGTERLTHAIAQLLPSARIERMDSDTSGRRGVRAGIVSALRRGAVDIVVGTQMITKGFDFPGVTLVGVVMADQSLNLPDFRSAERTFQVLTQVAGRAGRGDRPGRVLIQTYSPHHYSIRAARDQDYTRFIRRELELRRELGYPPFGRMALVRIDGVNLDRVNEIARRAAASLGRFAHPDTMRILGPAPAPIERLRGRYRWQVVVKSARLDESRRALTTMRGELAPQARQSDVRLAIDIDPVNMM
jgi:primosomal protein N' (replication factor Y)